jgi:heterodisulfide reductase subunit A-like polyferredoxin
VEPGRRIASFPVAEVDVEACTACAACAEVCSTGAISVEQHAEVDAKLCAGCGMCTDVCPEGAITFRQLD